MSSENRSPGTMLTRRNALKVGAGAGAATLGLSGVGVPNELEMAQDAEAVPPLIVYGAGVAGATVTTWALHELGVWGAQDPADGLGPDTLRTQISTAAEKRNSVNKSTMIDNGNIVEYLPEAAFSDAKVAAMEAIKNGKTKDAATTAGKDAAESHMARIEKNFLNSWNESVVELYNMVAQVKEHPDLTLIDEIYLSGSTASSIYSPRVETSYTLRNGESFTLYQVDTSNGVMDPRNTDKDVNGYHFQCGNYSYMKIGDIDRKGTWTYMHYQMQDEFDTILNNIALWVDNVYDQVKTGEVSPSDWLSGVDLADSIAEDDNRAQAIGELIAMNIPGDYDHESTIQLENDDAKLAGFLAYTGDDETPTLDAGTTIDPANFNGTWYLAYRPGTYIESWTAYDDAYGIQGGEIHFTSDPTTNDAGFDLAGVAAYAIETSHGETATVGPSDFTKTTDSNSNTIWVADLSDQLENTIADVTQVRRTYAGDSPDTYTTMALDQPATILDIEGTDSLTIQEDREPQTDTNYITDEEWQDILDQQQELIDRFEEASSSAGGGWSPSFDVPTWGPLDSIEDWGLAAIAAVVGSAVFGNLS